jgi:hypothetical protein
MEARTRRADAARRPGAAAATIPRLLPLLLLRGGAGRNLFLMHVQAYNLCLINLCLSDALFSPLPDALPLLSSQVLVKKFFDPVVSLYSSAPASARCSAVEEKGRGGSGEDRGSHRGGGGGEDWWRRREGSSRKGGVLLGGLVQRGGDGGCSLICFPFAGGRRQHNGWLVSSGCLIYDNPPT